MVTKGVIAPVSQPTEWVSLLTYPCKPDGSLCICLDPKDFNRAIVQEHYKAPTLDEISHHLSGATCFSKLNAKDGFWSIHLDETSSYLTTCSTCIMAGTGSYICHLVWRCPRTSSRCEWTRHQTIYLALSPFMMIYANLAVPLRSTMSTSCTWWRLPRTMVLSLTVLSATSDSLKLPFMVQSSLSRACGQIPPKSQALKDLSTHDSQVKLQSFLGLINYLQLFIPVLSAKTTFLWEQLAKWDWNPSTDAVFQHLKAWICQTLLNATLEYYDQSKPVIVQMDASEYELEAALIQSGCPIA